MILDFGLETEVILVKILLPLAIAFVVSMLVGLERQNVGKAAGISSHILVAIGSTGIAIMQRLMFEQQIFLQESGILINPEGQRVIAQVITGIGFIGAGVILKDSKNVIKGITTAATIWFCAMMGLILGSGYIMIGSILGLFVIVFISLRDFTRGFNPFLNRARIRRPGTIEE